MEKVIDLGKVAPTGEGPWSRARHYEQLTIVSQKGESFISLKPNVGVEPGTDETTWMCIAERGESLYQMMVREGKFKGSEAEFLNVYTDLVKQLNEAISSAQKTQNGMDVHLQEVTAEEERRKNNETQREADALGYARQMSVYRENEQARQESETSRVLQHEQRTADFDSSIAQMGVALQESADATLAARQATEETNAATQKATEQEKLVDAGLKEIKETTLHVESVTEENQRVGAAAVLQNAKDIAALKAVLQSILKGEAYLDGVLTRGVRINGAEECIIAEATPSAAPDFVGQRYVDTVARVCYMAVGNSSTSDWKAINV